MTDQPTPGPQSPPPGWYPDPGGDRVLRWWDGTVWAPHTQPMPDPQGSGPPYGAGPAPLGRPSRGGSHWVRNTLAVIGGLVVAGAVIGALSSGGTTSTGTASADSPSVASTSAPAADSNAASPAAPPPPTKVEFIVSGSAPDGIDITYGPAGSNLSGPSVLDGKAVMSVAFDSSTSYYALNAQLQGAGNIKCKIVVTGPGDQPLTVSHGAATGSYNICSAQAAPENNGLNWEDEN